MSSVAPPRLAIPSVRRTRVAVLVDVLPGAVAAVDDPVGDHLHRPLERQVLPLRAEGPAVLDGRDAPRAVDKLLARRSLRAEAAARDWRIRIALDLHDALTFDVHALPAADGAVGADALDDAIGSLRPRRQRVGVRGADCGPAAETVVARELANDRPGAESIADAHWNTPERVQDRRLRVWTKSSREGFDVASRSPRATTSGSPISTTSPGSQWTQAPQNVVLPDALDSYSLAYDAATHTVILVGYAVPSDDGEPQLPGHSGPETWSWNGSKWTFLHPATSPPSVEDPSIAYDAATQQVVLFGGELVSNPGNITQNGEASGATWLWNGTTWTEASAPVSAPARFGASMAYDPDLGATVLFGGVVGNVTADPPTGVITVFDDMWSWNGTMWIQMQPATLPPGRFFSQMTYDATRHELVLFGGSLNANADANDTWVFRTS